ncbi:pumilio-like 23 [Quillaja saponaria]|uniref:Pumilio-like 23 n=1 Tax=Quillaja saponaria TaxID=32244 RepID=A0AAD7LS73_QUISA|nr:pumilio-like 23 [Quillaja saponaria]
MNRKAKKENVGFDRDNSKSTASGRGYDGTLKGRKTLKYEDASGAQTSFIRKLVDAETAKYFSEIANLFESNGADLEERSVICGNAIEETRGKEYELATDYIISHTLQSLLEGCDVDYLCDFVQRCAKDFPSISMDSSGSHVVETAIKSLSAHLQNEESHHAIEEALTTICKVIAANLVDVMCNCYGSHVIRSLLCLCKGVQLDNSQYNVKKSSTVLAERLNFKAMPLKGDAATNLPGGFPDLLKFLISEMLKYAKEDNTLIVDQYSSLVLQTASKLLVGNDEELLHLIPVLLGCNEENIVEGNYIETTIAREVVKLLKENAFSHLMEVILEVAPEVLYTEMFRKIFRNSLFELSSHHCGNFVIQALISYSKNQEQMELIWEELGPKIKDLLEMRMSGVVAALIASSERLHVQEHKSCQALAAAVCPVGESPKHIVPRLLFLDSYFSCADKSNWNWVTGVKMHVMGSLILQSIFRFRSEYIQPYIISITTMEAEHVLEAAKDTGGARVIEAFLSSGASAKQKRRLVMKLKEHFGELSLHSSGSFTIEKCFTASNLSLREAIVSELLALRSELSRTKQGPYLLRRLDLEGFAVRPDQWRSKQSSKQSAYNEFYAAFGSGDTKSNTNNLFLADTSKNKSHPENLKEVRKEIDHRLSSTASFLSTSDFKRKPKKSVLKNEKHAKIAADDDVSNRKKKKLSKGGSENAEAAENKTESKNTNQELQASCHQNNEETKEKRWFL